MKKFKDGDDTIEHLFGSLLEDDEVIAQEFESTARALEARAESLRQWAARQRNKKNGFHNHIETVKKIPLAYAEAVADRVNDPVDHVATSLDIPRTTVNAWLGVYSKREAQHNREKRNREIVALARRGLTNKEIGARVGMHARSVQRIIKAQFRDHGQRAVSS